MPGIKSIHMHIYHCSGFATKRKPWKMTEIHIFLCRVCSQIKQRHPSLLLSHWTYWSLPLLLAASAIHFTCQKTWTISTFPNNHHHWFSGSVCGWWCVNILHHSASSLIHLSRVHPQITFLLICELCTVGLKNTESRYPECAAGFTEVKALALV